MRARVLQNYLEPLMETAASDTCKGSHSIWMENVEEDCKITGQIDFFWSISLECLQNQPGRPITRHRFPPNNRSPNQNLEFPRISSSEMKTDVTALHNTSRCADNVIKHDTKHEPICRNDIQDISLSRCGNLNTICKHAQSPAWFKCSRLMWHTHSHTSISN